MMLKKFAAALLATSMIAAVATDAYGMGGGGGGSGGSGAGAAGGAGGAGGAGMPPGGSPSVTDGATVPANRLRLLPARSTARDRHSRWRRARSAAARVAAAARSSMRRALRT